MILLLGHAFRLKDATPARSPVNGKQAVPGTGLPEQLGMVRVSVTIQHRDSNGHAKRTARITLSGGDGAVRNWHPKPRPMPPGWQCRCPDGCSERHVSESLYCERHYQKYRAPQQPGSRQSWGRKVPPRLDLV
jgi:hypothetical protein